METLQTVDPHYGRLSAVVDARLIKDGLLRNHIRISFDRPANPVVSIIIVSFNAPDLLILTLYRLASHYKLAGAVFEVIIVDNASGDETKTVLNILDGVEIIHCETNIGFGPACNLGAKSANGRYLLFLNPDVELIPGAIGALIEPFSDDTVGIVGARLVFPGGYLQECGAFFQDDSQLTHPYGRGNKNPFTAEGAFRRDVGYVSGAVMAVDRTLFNSLGGFDDLFAPAYFEDTDLCVRCHQSGRRVVYQPKATAIHFENATSPSRQDVDSLIDRNRQRFLDRHRSWLFQRHEAPPRFADRTYDSWALKVLFIDDAVPHLDLGAGMPRSNLIVTLMAQLGYQVTIYPVYRSDVDMVDRYRDLPDTIEILDSGGEAGLSALLDGRCNHYDVVWVSRPHNINLLCELIQSRDIGLRVLARRRVIFDSEALFCVRDFLESTLKRGVGFGATFGRNAAAEIRNFSQADHVICVSESEARLLKNFGLSNVSVLGHAFEPPPRDVPNFGDRDGFAFIGSLSETSSPNTDSLLWFFETIWPHIRSQAGDVKFRVIGEVSSEVSKMLSYPGVSFEGRVMDPAPLYDQSRVFVAPTRFAAGVPHKVHGAIAQGLPCIVTPILAEQVGWPDGSGFRCHDWRTPDDFASGLLRLYSDESIWRAVQKKGFEYIAQDCSLSIFRTTLRCLCEPSVVA
ncbi:glycosyltransferase [Methylobacterium radiotolerans]|uniref:Glycosyl transferase family 2 n=1 Tax=Methylobacterium radiotolerans (strain ATCC 27329 / DSM 1819 / JCM 2831 / NBRC 15690 / NCIMB 10815 / 0-1) TaxID=426355 RepID=B1M2S6_METRJ|nr:glycosyltransferase [Methylobacterium radiotolerans]ACB23217.1 glycosyl transferase family 2 [Methylobacterium radiotolerans JCM 2831]